jgi:homoserine O-acetyltransferase
MEVSTYAAGDVVLQSGATLPDARIVYATYGELNARRDNVVLYPTRFGGSHEDNDYLVGAGRALDPERWFVVVPNMLGNGVSSSPSNTPAPVSGSRFPRTTQLDNVRLQRQLLSEVFGIGRLALVVGWSMGGQQAYHWGALYPDDVDRVAVLCGAARTAPHTHVFLEGMRAALTADVAFAEGDYAEPPVRGLRAMGRAWAGWALSQAFYRHDRYRELGYSSLEDFLVRYWEGMFLGRDANNLLSMIDTWQAADVSANDRYAGDFRSAMAAISAEVLVMPGRTDLYFPPEDSELEVELLGRGQLVVIPSEWGHYAGGAKNPVDIAFVDGHLRQLLARG